MCGVLTGFITIYLRLSGKCTVYYCWLFALPIVFALFYMLPYSCFLTKLSFPCYLPTVTAECIVGFNLEFTVCGKLTA